MELSDTQKTGVKKWLSDGADVGEVQKRLEAEFGISMTYIDVRFLIDDIGAEILDKPELKSDSAENVSCNGADSAEGAVSADEASSGEFSETADNDSAELPFDGREKLPAEADKFGGNVEVSLSPIQRPGTLASGEVTFSDGVKCQWILDQTGQLGLVPPTKGYQPPQSDLGDFQIKLQNELKKIY